VRAWWWTPIGQRLLLALLLLALLLRPLLRLMQLVQSTTTITTTTGTCSKHLQTPSTTDGRYATTCYKPCKGFLLLLGPSPNHPW
jgi:hypothetical protein